MDAVCPRINLIAPDKRHFRIENHSVRLRKLDGRMRLAGIDKLNRAERFA